MKKKFVREVSELKFEHNEFQTPVRGLNETDVKVSGSVKINVFKQDLYQEQKCRVSCPDL